MMVFLTSFLNLGLSFGLIAFISLWEYKNPRRVGTMSRAFRWTQTGGIFVADRIFWRVIRPLSAVQLALICHQHQWGLFNQLHLPNWATIALAIAALDIGHYGIHVLQHKIPLLWRVHRVHHLDTEFDVTTSLRSHPLDGALYAVMILAVVFVTGAPPEATIIYSLMTTIISKLNHGNIYISESVDHYLRMFFVTPDVHRVHHSALREENDSNYGAHFTLWDRLFGTYCAHPVAGYEDMVIGLDDFRAPKEIRLDRLLLRPFTEAK